MNDLIKQIDEWFTETDECGVENISDVGELRNMLLDAREQLAKAQTAVAVVERLKEMIPSSDFSSIEITYFHEHELDYDDEPPWMVSISGKDIEGPTLEAAVLGDGMEGE